GTTPTGLPYPEPTDPVAAGADNIKALAQAVDPRPRGVLVRALSTAAANGYPGGGLAVTTLSITAPVTDPTRMYRVLGEIPVLGQAGATAAAVGLKVNGAIVNSVNSSILTG